MVISILRRRNSDTDPEIELHASSPDYLHERKSASPTPSDQSLSTHSPQPSSAQIQPKPPQTISPTNPTTKRTTDPPKTISRGHSDTSMRSQPKYKQFPARTESCHQCIDLYKNDQPTLRPGAHHQVHVKTNIAIYNHNVAYPKLFPKNQRVLDDFLMPTMTYQEKRQQHDTNKYGVPAYWNLCNFYYRMFNLAKTRLQKTFPFNIFRQLHVKTNLTEHHVSYTTADNGRRIIDFPACCITTLDAPVPKHVRADNSRDDSFAGEFTVTLTCHVDFKQAMQMQLLSRDNDFATRLKNLDTLYPQDSDITRIGKILTAYGRHQYETVNDYPNKPLPYPDPEDSDDIDLFRRDDESTTNRTSRFSDSYSSLQTSPSAQTPPSNPISGKRKSKSTQTPPHQSAQLATNSTSQTSAIPPVPAKKPIRSRLGIKTQISNHTRAASPQQLDTWTNMPTLHLQKAIAAARSSAIQAQINARTAVRSPSPHQEDPHQFLYQDPNNTYKFLDNPTKQLNPMLRHPVDQPRYTGNSMQLYSTATASRAIGPNPTLRHIFYQ